MWVKGILFFLAAFLQGVNLVLYPAAATLLTDPEYQHLSAHEYGSLFIPMILGAIGLSYFGGLFEEKKGHRAILICALFFNGLSNFLFALSALTPFSHNATLVILLIALFCLGLGFGSMLTILTPYMLALYPNHKHAATVISYSIFCIGAFCSPILFHLASQIGLWWLDPLVIGGAFLSLIFLIFLTLPSKEGESELFPPKTVESNQKRYPLLFWLFFSSMLLYGITSTVYINWTTIYLHEELKFPSGISNYALSLFWATMLIGRAAVVGGDKWIRPKVAYVVLPLLMTLSFLIVPLAHSITANLWVFAFAGLACSASFPLIYSFAAQTYPHQAAAVSGRITTAYMLGYGITAYGVGYLYDLERISLQEIFFYAWPLALLFSILSLIIMRDQELKE